MQKRITDTGKGKGIVSEQSRCLSTRFSASSSVSKPSPTALDTGRSRNPPTEACWNVVKMGMLFAVCMLVMAVFAGVVSGANEAIFVVTDRFVILDEPRTGYSTGTNFYNPSNDYGADTYWDGASTRITATSLFMLDNGTPANNKQVNFTLYKPDGSVFGSIASDNTNSSGLAYSSWQLDAAGYYGNWTVKAESDGISKNTTFILLRMYNLELLCKKTG